MMTMTMITSTTSRTMMTIKPAMENQSILKSAEYSLANADVCYVYQPMKMLVTRYQPITKLLSPLLSLVEAAAVCKGRSSVVSAVKVLY